jgi:hypothetical protein
MHGERIRMHIGFWWESQKKRDHYEDLDVEGSIKIDRREIGWAGSAGRD